MKNSIRERAKKVPKRIKIKVALTVWWLKLRQYFVIKSVCGKCGNKNIKRENGKQVHCSWCDTDW